jgi:hypothetical protein
LSKDAIVFLKDQHKQVTKLFKEFEGRRLAGAAGPGRRADPRGADGAHLPRERGDVPGGPQAAPDLEDDVLESYEEHHVADVLCMELSTMSPDDERFEAKATVLIENVTHHVEEEEPA